MKILFVTPELAPWSKAGGLGDATVALGKALAALGGTDSASSCLLYTSPSPRDS